VDATHVARALGLPPGTRIGRYTLVRRVAMGGMAEVYLAQLRGAERFAKLVALKLILPQFAGDPEFARMFLDEARLASRLQHPNVTAVLDFGEYQGEHFITMEFVHGRHLLELMRAHRGRPLARDVALTIVSGVAAGLHHMHELRDHDGSPLGLVHRDVSPSNVLLSYEGAVKLTDFGIAKAVEHTSATRTGAFKGKVGYASPEQCRGEPIDRRSDLFALGILLYETTLGARAFSGPNEFAVLGRVARADYVPPSQIDPDYPPALAEIVAKALAVDPADRFATAALLADALDGYAHAQHWRLAPARVVEAMTTHFGETPPITSADEASWLATDPSTRVAATSLAGASIVAPTPAGPRRRLAATIAGTLALVGTTAVAVTLVARPSEATPSAAPVVDTAPAAATDEAPPSVAPVLVPTVVIAAPAAPSTAAPSTAAPSADPTAAPNAEPAVDVEPPNKGPKRRRPTKRADKPAAAAVPDNLYPPGYRP